ncbi:MAG: hypothetical protein NC200_07655 [Candidatus Gastranaerophilales bacterium]|nr:hypothetical protein [Candidatus Gastranaerophilales bacterium]
MAVTNTVSTTQSTQTANYGITNTTNNMNNMNAFPMMFGPSMANDYFGSQAFGTGSIYTTQAATPTVATAPATQTQPTAVTTPEIEIPNIFDKAPDNYASALLQGHAIESNPALKQMLEQSLAEQNIAQTTQTAPAQASQTTIAQAAAPAVQQTSQPTMQDYYIATQIANQFANATPIAPLNSTDAFMQSQPGLTFTPGANRPLNVSYTA